MVVALGAKSGSMLSRSTACLRATGAAGAPRGAGSQEKSLAGAAASGAGGGGAGAAALGAGGGGTGAPAFFICGISALGVGGGPPTAAMAARTRAAKASSAQIEKALTDFLGCARTNARARTLSEPEAARRAESAAALMEEEIAKDMTVVGCVCGAEGVRERGSTWRLDTRFGWFSSMVAVGQNWRNGSRPSVFYAKWHLRIFQSNPARAVFYASFRRLRASPRRHVAYTDQNVFDFARALSLCAARSVSRLAGAHRSPIFARNISPALSTTTDTEPKEYT